MLLCDNNLAKCSYSYFLFTTKAQKTRRFFSVFSVPLVVFSFCTKLSTDSQKRTAQMYQQLILFTTEAQRTRRFFSVFSVPLVVFSFCTKLSTDSQKRTAQMYQQLILFTTETRRTRRFFSVCILLLFCFLYKVNSQKPTPAPPKRGIYVPKPAADS